ARKYILDPLTAPEPCQETWSCSWRIVQAPAPAQRDLRDALQKVNKRLRQFKQRCRRHSSAGGLSRTGSLSSSASNRRGRGRDRGRSGSGGDDDSSGTDGDCVGNNCGGKQYTSGNCINSLCFHRTRTSSPVPNLVRDRPPANDMPATHYASRYPRDARRAIAAGRICYFDPTNPYFGTFSPRYARPRPSPVSHHARPPAPGSSRRRSSAPATVSPAPPLFLGFGLDLGPYPAHLTHPRPASHSDHHQPSRPVSWENHLCRQLEKTRQLRASR
ncbi:hypothetical protein E4U53_000541, partial [Claviceps sorghi]